MRLRTKRSQGFTLIEIIIVVVILGILAAIALPKITQNVDKARAAEVFQTASQVNGAYQRCIDEHTGGLRVAVAADVSACNTFTLINLTSPTAQSQSFTYTLSNGGTTLSMVAQGKFAGNAGVDHITFSWDATSGGAVKLCGGIFTQMCKN